MLLTLLPAQQWKLLQSGRVQRIPASAMYVSPVPVATLRLSCTTCPIWQVPLLPEHADMSTGTRDINPTARNE